MKDDETKLMCIDELLRELRRREIGSELVLKEVSANEYKIKPVKKQPDGGDVKMRQRSRLGTFALAGLSSVLVWNLTSRSANKDMQAYQERLDSLSADFQEYRENSVPYSQIAVVAQLNEELDRQVQDANAFLTRTTQAETQFKGFVDAARDYMRKSTPQGELEEEAAREVETLNQFFDSYDENQQTLSDMIEGCYEASSEIEEQRTSPLTGYREVVRRSNEGYSSVFENMASKLTEEIRCLTEFINHAQRYPLRDRAAMIERTREEIAGRQEILEDVQQYRTVFVENNESDGILPVKARAENEQNELAAAEYSL